MTEFELTTHDKASSLWLRFCEYLNERLADARRRNDATTLSEHDTAALRGEIRCLKKLLALGDDRPILTGDEEPAP